MLDFLKILVVFCIYAVLLLLATGVGWVGVVMFRGALKSVSGSKTGDPRSRNGRGPVIEFKKYGAGIHSSGCASDAMAHVNTRKRRKD